MFIDAHCHLTDLRFEGIRDQVIEKARKSQVTHFIQGGVDLAEWDRQVELKRALSSTVTLVFGIHPWTIAHQSDVALRQAFDRLPEYLKEAKALGEIGLDFGPRTSKDSYALQEEYFRRQLRLAKEGKFPVVLHVVRAHDQVMNILNQEGFPAVGGIVHAFSGSYEIAKRYIDLGLHLSLGAAATQEKYQETLRNLSLDSIVVESDAPDMLPRGVIPDFFDSERKPLNAPHAIWYVANAVAKAKNMQPEDVLKVSGKHCSEIFRLKLDGHDG